MRARFALGLSLFALGCPAPRAPGDGPTPEAPPVRVGFIGSLTGRSASFGTSARNGVELAFTGATVHGRRVKVSYLDDQGRPEDARQAAQRLITKEKVRLLLGAVESDTSLAAAEVAERAQVPMLSPSSTLPKLTQAGGFVFRACFTDQAQGRVMARFARERLGLRQVAVLRAVSSEYSVELADVFAREFARLGGRVLIDEAYVAGDPDLDAALERVVQASPEAVFIPGYYDEVVRIAPGLRQLGLRAPLLGGDGWDSDRLLEEAASAVEGAHFSSHFHPEQPGAAASAFVAAYQEAFNETPDAIAALAFDAARVALAGLARAAPAADGPGLRVALASTEAFEGVTGRIGFTAGGDAEKAVVVLRIEGGRRRFVAALAPEVGEAAPTP